MDRHNHSAPPPPNDALYRYLSTAAPSPSNPQSPLTGHDAHFLHSLLPAYQPTHTDSPYPFTEVRIDDHDPPEPTPPATSFFESILNPASLDHGRYSPFVYRPSPPQPSLPGVHDMTPSARATGQDAQRPGRLSNGYVDLTSTPDSPPQRRKRESSSPGPSAKRAKRDQGRAGNEHGAATTMIEEVDLTGDANTGLHVPQTQRLDAVKVPPKPEETVTNFNTFTCVICMDTPTDLTATSCGHLFCHTCLMEALVAGENRTGPSEAKRSQCPICRKVLNRNKSSDVIPLLLMKKGLATQPRKKVAVVSTAAAAKSSPLPFSFGPPSTLPNSSQPPSMSKQTPTIAILGAGDVGATIAYSLILNPSAGEILLVDPQESVRDAQIQDLSDATYHGNTTVRIRAGTHAEAGQCDIIIMAAGAAQKKGESRTDLITKNKKIMQSAIEDMKPFREDAVLLVVANPVDVLTYYAQSYSGLPRTQVFGSGTFLDSARLRGEIAKKIGIAASSIDAYVLGEHGESQFVAWSLVGVTGIPMATAIASSSSNTSTTTTTTTKRLDQTAIAETVKNKASVLIENKGNTNFGIGAVAASLCKSVLSDERVVRAVSVWREDLGVCLSVPVLVGRGGVVGIVEVGLDEEEQQALERSARALRDVMGE
ncbi:hypothetical protein T440DRAFT_502916 [Plenodomus tracheiphilus IPT5]|uniref:RING-type domain-containing protein n=1 Tax=Plenodomus tracheiphilus IPT5 TaxID=1408161 RepID=A0A6A7AR68_9PLEO|nr:hypothetical protein T440DRAFT_502916 [Plenodomus tracheiphilus IPT5]